MQVGPASLKKALHQSQHESPSKPVHSPSKYGPPKYGEGAQVAPVGDPREMAKTGILYSQQTCGKSLYYARAVDDTMLHALGELAPQQSKGTGQTIRAMLHPLNYAATYPGAGGVYTKDRAR